MRNVVLATHQQLNRVLSSLERQLCLGLPRSEVEVVEVIGYRLIERGQLGVNQDVMVTGVRAIDPRRRNAHILQAEMNRDRGRDHRPVLYIVEVYFGSRGRGRRAAGQWNSDVDARRHDGRIVRNVILVAHEQLQRMLARLQSNLRLGLACSEMQMIEVVGNGLVKGGQQSIDQE